MSSGNSFMSLWSILENAVKIKQIDLRDNSFGTINFNSGYVFRNIPDGIHFYDLALNYTELNKEQLIIINNNKFNSINDLLNKEFGISEENLISGLTQISKEEFYKIEYTEEELNEIKSNLPSM